MRNVVFKNDALNDFIKWVMVDKHIFNKITELIHENQLTPFTGKGKLELLKDDYKGC